MSVMQPRLHRKVRSVVNINMFLQTSIRKCVFLDKSIEILDFWPVYCWGFNKQDKEGSWKVARKR